MGIVQNKRHPRQKHTHEEQAFILLLFDVCDWDYLRGYMLQVDDRVCEAGQEVEVSLARIKGEVLEELELTQVCSISQQYDTQEPVRIIGLSASLVSRTNEQETIRASWNVLS